MSGQVCEPEGPADYARVCVECLVSGRPVPDAPDGTLYTRQAACFVSLKKDGQLRGCIGTLEPAEPHLGAEIARNARSAAFEDPRFARVREDELVALACSVDVLSPSEPCTLDDDAPAAGEQVVDHSVGAARVLGDRELLLGRDESCEMLPGPGELRGVGLVGHDSEPRVHLHRVGDDDVGAPSLREADGHIGLAQRGGAEERDHRRRVSHRRRRPPRARRRSARLHDSVSP